jgi:hypothetical protein
VLVLRACHAVSEGVSVAGIRKCVAYGAEDRVQRSSGMDQGGQCVRPLCQHHSRLVDLSQ